MLSEGFERWGSACPAAIAVAVRSTTYTRATQMDTQLTLQYLQGVCLADANANLLLIGHDPVELFVLLNPKILERLTQQLTSCDCMVVDVGIVVKVDLFEIAVLASVEGGGCPLHWLGVEVACTR